MKQKVGYTYEFDASCANGALDNNFSECKRSVATYKLGNMKTKKSSEVTVTGSKKGDDLNYEFDYEVEEGRAHRYSRIGTRYYKYDEVGNLLAEQTGAFGTEDDDNLYKIEELKEKTYGMNEGWGVFNKEESAEGSKTHHRKTDRRTYEWNAENQLVETSDEAITVGYTYGADGKRASKYTHNSETLYFNDYWVWHIDNATKDRGGKVTKNIYLGTERLASRIGSYKPYAGEENENTFFYHSDHLGSAQLVTDCNGDEYQRIEYTPYGETWIDLKTQISLIAKLPYKFSAKELDEETGLYYYGARYLDPRMSRWISADPAMNTGEYFSNPDAGMGGIYNHVNFNLYHYAGNNPINYTDPDGRMAAPSSVQKIPHSDMGFPNNIKKMIDMKKGRILPLNQAIFGSSDYCDKTNCYAYAFNLFKNEKLGVDFNKGNKTGEIYGLQPGMLCRKMVKPGELCNRMAELDAAKTMDDYCNKLVELVTADAAAIGYTFKPTTLDGDVTPGNWKVAIVAGVILDPATRKSKMVYHFYRLEQTGTWSQKPGHYAPNFGEYNGEPKKIVDPKNELGAISGGEYTRFVGYFECGLEK